MNISILNIIWSWTLLLFIYLSLIDKRLQQKETSRILILNAMLPCSRMYLKRSLGRNVGCNNCFWAFTGETKFVSNKLTRDFEKGEQIWDVQKILLNTLFDFQDGVFIGLIFIKVVQHPSQRNAFTSPVLVTLKTSGEVLTEYIGHSFFDVFYRLKIMPVP